MKTPRIDNVVAGVVFAFDADTGELLHTHEKLVEVVDGERTYDLEVTAEECEEVRADAARTYRGRRVDAVIAPKEMTQRRGDRYAIDPMTRQVREEPDCEPDFAEHLAVSRRTDRA